MSLNLQLKPASNSMAFFYPINTRGESDGFDWDTLTNLFICDLYGIEISKPSKLIDQLLRFEETCQSKFFQILDDPNAWNYLKKIYFEEKNIATISPKLRIYSLSDQIEKCNAEKRFLGFMKNLFYPEKNYKNKMDSLNFIEKIIAEIFDEEFVTKSPSKAKVVNYLPAMVETYSEDLEFLTQYPKYFLDNIQLFLKTYIFAYSTQLALTVNNWRDYQDNKIAECYFILDFEKASKERTLLQKGYKSVDRGLSSIFPILSMTESLQHNLEEKQPLWKFHHRTNEINLNDLIEYCKAFADYKDLSLRQEYFSTHMDVFNELEKLFKAQFSKNEVRNLSEVNNKIINGIKNIVLEPFVKNRGSIGKIFALNQEYLLLLTNLAIGNRDKLRLYELIKEFEKRGFFFDKESYKALVVFYERLGNVEKMSDSGDAIYVKKTI